MAEELKIYPGFIIQWDIIVTFYNILLFCSQPKQLIYQSERIDMTTFGQCKRKNRKERGQSRDILFKKHHP